MDSQVLTSSPEQSKSCGLEFKHRHGATRDAPAIFLIHGRAGNYDNMWAFKRCVPDHWHIVAPQAPRSDALGGWSWWDVPRTDGFLTQVTHGVASILTFIDSYEAEFGLTPQTRVACGFSQGAAMLSVIIQSDPAVFSKVGLLAGFVLPSNAINLTHPRPPVFIAHGTKDEIVSVEDSRSGQSRLERLGFTVERVEDDVGHKVGVKGMKRLTEWLSGAS